MVQQTRERKVSAASERSNGSELIKIALADDHAIFRDGLRRLLALEPDFKIVAEAKDGTEVLPILEEHELDILLLVKNHIHNIFDKLGVSDRLELALYAIHRNIRPL